MAKIVQDFEPDLTSLLIRPFDDGRFVVSVNGEQIYNKERTGTFPKYDADIKPKLAKRRE